MSKRRNSAHEICNIPHGIGKENCINKSLDREIGLDEKIQFNQCFKIPKLLNSNIFT